MRNQDRLVDLLLCDPFMRNKMISTIVTFNGQSDRVVHFASPDVFMIEAKNQVDRTSTKTQ